MIKYVQGDLFDASEQVIAHGCNCSGGFGSGVAGIIARKYPGVRNAYMDKFHDSGWKLGEIQPVFSITADKYIVNCATQQAYLPRGVCHADYEAIATAMLSVKEFAQQKGLSIAIPKIGAGLAGGDWNIIENILETVFSDYDITVYYL